LLALSLPVLSEVEGPVLSEVEGPVLSEVEGPVLSEVEGPVPSLSRGSNRPADLSAIASAKAEALCEGGSKGPW